MFIGITSRLEKFVKIKQFFSRFQNSTIAIVYRYTIANESQVPH